MIWKETQRQPKTNGQGNEDVVFVYYNGRLIYKRWVDRGYGVVFDVYKSASVFYPGNVAYVLRTRKEPFTNIMQNEYNSIA